MGRRQLFETVKRGGISLLESVVMPQGVKRCIPPVEPQAQLSYQNIAIDDASDGAATIGFSDVESLLGRVGVRLAKSWELAPDTTNHRRLTGWLRVSYAHQFLEKPTITFTSDEGPTPFDGDFSGSSIILNAGLDTDLGKNIALYANVDYEVSLDDLGEAIGGEIGFKVRW